MDYRISELKQLRDQQVRFAPREKKVQQLERAEKLISEIDPQKTYTYEYLCFRITDYRPEVTPNVKMSGATARHDLRLFVEDVSESAGLCVDEISEPVHTLEELSRMFKVSLKTISRWREQGLVSRRLVFDGRTRVGFLKSSVERFVERNQDKVARGERFSLLSDDERNEIIERARRLAHSGGGLSEVSRRIAKHLQRSVETVRSTLKQFDEKHPHLAIFPNYTGPLSDQAKTRIYQQYRRGTSTLALSKRYNRTKASIYRIVNEIRAKRILELPLDYIDNPEFSRRDCEKKIFAPLPEADAKPGRVRIPSGLPSYLASLYEVPLLTREQESHLFRQFNYLKYKASKLCEQLKPERARSSQMDEIERLYERAIETKNRIVQANLRLVVSIAKRHMSPTEDLFSLISDGNMSLISAVEKFDYARGNKFSTYASWAIMKNYARSIPHEYRHRDRFRTSQEEVFFSQEDGRGDQYEQETAQHLRQQQVGTILAHLDEREQRIIISRFGLDHSQNPQTLKEVGQTLGVTKERVRQIEARALNKLRLAAQSEKIDLPD